VTPDEIQGRILYRDAMMLVINKPAGIAVHEAHPNAKSRGNHMEQFFPHLMFGLPNPPTRSPIGSTKTHPVAWCLAATARRWMIFQSSSVKAKMDKTYWAIVAGGPDRGRRFYRYAAWQNGPARAAGGMKPDPAGLPAQTGWRVMGRGEGSTWLELSPQTGRTHQLRVHCQAMGWPISGDPIYGDGRETGEMLHLHARAITIPFYKNKPPITAEARHRII